jgi:uncharacterized phage protein gp47/JayE
MAVIPIPAIDQDGITLPEYANVHEGLRGLYREIYGQDIYIEPDSQDGQFLAILARAMHDTFSVAFATYNAFSPSTAQGVGLSRVVKINGIRKNIPTFSTVDLRIVGEVGAVISQGVARDDQERRWLLPATVIIPIAGEITVTAVAAEPGAWVAPPGSVTVISTPTRGWQTVSNLSTSVPGSPVETDLKLRVRQTLSTAIPSLTLLDGMIGAVAAVPGVTRWAVYENDTDIVDVDGRPAHSVTFVVEGGDSVAIAQVLLAKKSPGTSTYGSLQITVNDAYGIPHFIRFSRPTIVPIQVAITLKALANYSGFTENLIQQTVSDWINARKIGEDILLTRLYVPANLSGLPASDTFEILTLTVGRIAVPPPLAADINLTYYEAASCTPGDVAITATT